MQPELVEELVDGPLADWADTELMPHADPEMMMPDATCKPHMPLDAAALQCELQCELQLALALLGEDVLDFKPGVKILMILTAAYCDFFS